MDYASLIHSIVDSFIENPENILIKELPTEKENDVTILIVATNNDIARLIGKKGSVANAIRDIVSIAGRLENKRIHLKFESFDEEEKGE